MLGKGPVSLPYKNKVAKETGCKNKAVIHVVTCLEETVYICI